MAQLLAPDGLLDVLIGMNVLVDIIIRAEYAACAGLPARAVDGLLERRDAVFAVFHLQRHQSAVVAARDALQRVAARRVPEHPAVAQHRHIVGIGLLRGDDSNCRDADFALKVVLANLVHQVVAYGVAPCLLVAADGDVAYAVGIVSIEILHKPAAVNALHIKFMFFNVILFRISTFTH